MKFFRLLVSVTLPCVFVFMIVLFLASAAQSASLPVSVTSQETSAPQTGALTTSAPTLPKAVSPLNSDTDLPAFRVQVMNGNAGAVVGVYAPQTFALKVLQQPAGHPEFVDREDNVLTEFSLARPYGVTGLLAHNYLSGKKFYDLKTHQDIVLIYGDGRLEHYRISKVESYQALDPSNPYSDFVDMADTAHTILSSGDLFHRVYTARNQVVFQTCIAAGDESSWGRMFVTATLAEPLTLDVPAVGANISLN